MHSCIAVHEVARKSDIDNISYHWFLEARDAWNQMLPPALAARSSRKHLGLLACAYGRPSSAAVTSAPSGFACGGPERSLKTAVFEHLGEKAACPCVFLGGFLWLPSKI